MSERQSTYKERSGAAVGWISFAGIMLIMIGTFHAIAGLAGIFENEFYSDVPAAGTEATGDVYFLQFDATTWGWIHLIGGIIVLFAGVGLFRGAVWARTVGVIVAVISAIVSFAWLPWYPGLVDHDHRDQHRRDLGVDRAWTRHRRRRVGPATTRPSSSRSRRAASGCTVNR
jgi:hypothetical protein